MITLILTMIMLLAAPSAYANDQRLLICDHAAVHHMQDLYLASGRSLPSMSGPFSVDEMKKMLSYVDYSSLDEDGKALYDRVRKEIEPPRLIQTKDGKLDFNMGVHGDVHVHARTYPAFSNSYDRFGIPGYKIPAPVVEMVANLDFADHFSFFTNLGIGLVRNPQTKETIGNNHILSNMILLPPFSTLDVSPNTPTRASMAAGGDGWSFELGRNKLAWGPGITGNFLFGNHINYNDMIRFSGYTEHFKYSFVSSFYVHPKNYFGPSDTDPDEDIFKPHFTQTGSIGGIAMLMAHRIEVRPTPRLNFALTEAIMYQNEDNYLDLRIFNPIMLYHNLYIKSYANSLLTFEFDVNLIKGLDLYFQIAIDDLAVPFVENDPNVPGSTSPNSTGQMIGLRYAHPMKDGVLRASAELTTTSPFLYLRNHAKGSVSQDRKYGLSFITGIREYGSEEGSRYDLEYIGYQYGGDAIVLNLNAGFECYDRWSAEGTFFYMAHGTVDQYTRWQEYETAASGPHTPTSKHPENGTFHPEGESWAESKDAVEHTFVLEAKGGYRIARGLDLTSALDLITVIAPGNHKADGTVFDLQFKIGLSYQY